MLIFEKKPEIKEQTWEKEFRWTLVLKCRQFLEVNSRKKRKLLHSKLWQNFRSVPKFPQNHSYLLLDNGQGIYSQYIPITKTHLLPNEIVQYFPYLRLLSQNQNSQYQNELFQIQDKMKSNKCYKEWMKVSKKYVSSITLEQMLNFYNILLIKGTEALAKMRKISKTRCLEAAFYHKILEMKKFMQNNTKINSNITISIDKGEQVNLGNMSITMKHLFCTICLNYDCSKHIIPKNVIENNFQYTRQFDQRQRLEEKKMSAFLLLKQFHDIMFESKENGNCQSQHTQSRTLDRELNETVKIINNQQHKYCSQNCFRQLTPLRWKELQQKRRQRIFSPVFNAIMEMGVEIYSFQPCYLRQLFTNTPLGEMKSKDIHHQADCQDIFYFLMHDYQLINKMVCKFYKSQADQLLNEVKNACDPYHHQKKDHKKKRNTKKSIKNVGNHQKSACFHYFIEKQPQDLNCQRCDCRKRGYCLPECLCSQSCGIQLSGCKCKDSTCQDNKCNCFKRNILCTPDRCENCFEGSYQQQRNCCQSNQRNFNRGKITRIGRSTIQNAGLGLFAGQYIPKGSFVIKYIGQVVASECLQKLRQNLEPSDLLYTFKLSQNQNLDARMFGNKARFINHSLIKANVTPRTLKIKQEETIVFMATKDIQADQEIFFNYNGAGELNEFMNKYPFLKN